MLVIGTLLLYAALLGVAGNRVLTRAAWVVHSPRTALCLWHTCAVTFLATIACVLVLTAHDVWEHAVVWLFHADEPQVHALYSGSWYADEIATGATVVLLAAVSSVTVLTVRRLRIFRHERNRHRLVADALAPYGTGPLRRVRVLEDPVPAAFCIPGSRHDARIVLTRGALSLLTPEQVSATVAHEQAHLSYRHHRVIVLADVVTAAVGWSGALRDYAEQTRRLAEMVADDHAADEHGQRTLAVALLEMSAAPGNTIGSLPAMTGADPAERIRRLIAGRHCAADRALPLLAAGAAVALLMVPTTVSLAPAATVANTAHCPPRCDPPTQE
ncbi:M56 family metallopeptidase [Streptomyces sp. NPDC088124]|uniref:M56 family metallopeptidase n=1 Tax=Streptomyces sp. NPDC088124 TaxID=3154654 RepID=UPI00342330BD